MSHLAFLAFLWLALSRRYFHLPGSGCWRAWRGYRFASMLKDLSLRLRLLRPGFDETTWCLQKTVIIKGARKEATIKPRREEMNGYTHICWSALINILERGTKIMTYRYADEESILQKYCAKDNWISPALLSATYVRSVESSWPP